MIKEVTYRYDFGEGDIVFEKKQVIEISEDVVIRVSKEMESGIMVDRVAKTREGYYVYVEEVMLLHVDEGAIANFQIEELYGLSAIGLLTKLSNLTLGRDAS
ncbi:hypothetical protein [Priestia megaterium]|uniref:hypothetical protein n=1 Tax=Priestia megaterium TaxID=1404 RepID=UPI000BF658CC|nr:hypothetical protein [Priestia megaterium]MED4060253.1 hypothetical protein [Priestia megaterium]PFP08568.1 hypothetical protein COJ90_21790 [Priestia megaterium]PFR91306.1 hypothetical protein COK39_22770 [Priestia megaterium]